MLLIRSILLLSLVLVLAERQRLSLLLVLLFLLLLMLQLPLPPLTEKHMTTLKNSPTDGDEGARGGKKTLSTSFRIQKLCRKLIALSAGYH